MSLPSTSCGALVGRVGGGRRVRGADRRSDGNSRRVVPAEIDGGRPQPGGVSASRGGCTRDTSGRRPGPRSRGDGLTALALYLRNIVRRGTRNSAADPAPASRWPDSRLTGVRSGGDEFPWTAGERSASSVPGWYRTPDGPTSDEDGAGGLRRDGSRLSRPGDRCRNGGRVRSPANRTGSPGSREPATGPGSRVFVWGRLSDRSLPGSENNIIIRR